MIYANVYAAGHSNNSMFATEDSVHRFNPTYTPRLLREALLGQGIELNTPDVNQGRDIAFDLFFEGREFAEDGIPKYLIALENPNINRLNENREYCKRFRKVFAWDKRLYDLPNAVQIMVPNRLEFEPFPSFAKRDIFSCLINANKAFREPLPADLYLERINTIRWYERNAPEYFELYGMGWQKPAPAFNLWGKLKRSVASLRVKLHGYKPFPSYRGEVRDKSSVMRRSKFAYCYENTIGPDNYITEKIFDSFLSGCVPVYWGAENVLEHIPADCFIDRRAFADTAAMHAYLCSVTPERYAQYQHDIARFLRGGAVRKFSAEHFVEVVAGRIAQDIIFEKYTNPPGSNSIVSNGSVSSSADVALTIAIPTYNRQRYLAELLPELVAQCKEANACVPRVEVLVIDNASADSTSAYVTGNFPNDVRYFRNDTNIGPDANFIECVRRSSGHYVWLFGDDEIINKNAVVSLLELIQKRPALIIAGSDFEESRFFPDYSALLRYALPLDPIFPVHHTLITANVFPRDGFDVEIASDRISTSYGHMYAIAEHLETGKGVFLLGKNESAFRTRDVRAEFHWIPVNLENKLVALCAHISDVAGVRRLKFNVWLFYRARRIYKLMHSRTIRRLLSILRAKHRS